ncbi:hypothetical protein [Neisseria musculi]|nr:hypothetical protein [Neisseria musculi]
MAALKPALTAAPHFLLTAFSDGLTPQNPQGRLPSPNDFSTLSQTA